MDIYDYLKMDHDHVARLFKQFEKSESLIRQQQIVELIAQELLIHADSEQAIFYKALEQFDETKDEAVHGKKEHAEIKENIAEILYANEWGASWHEQVLRLKELVEHHVNEEEGPIFKKAKKVLTKEDAWELKEKMHYLKQQLLLKLQQGADDHE